MRIVSSVGVVAAATAAMVGLSAPNAFASTSSVGGCAGGIAFHNPHVLVHPDPSITFVGLEGQIAEIGSGFYAGIPATNVVLTCSIQRNSEFPRTNVAASFSSAPGTGVAVVEPVVTAVSTAPGDRLYLCASVAFVDPDGTSKDEFIGCMAVVHQRIHIGR